MVITWYPILKSWCVLCSTHPRAHVYFSWWYWLESSIMKSLCPSIDDALVIQWFTMQKISPFSDMIKAQSIPGICKWKTQKTNDYPFLAELLRSLGSAEAEYKFLKYSAPLLLAFLFFPFSPNRGGRGIWQLLEYMFRIHLLEHFSWSLDRNAFSLKEWNYELSERIWINMRWILGLGFLLLCFVFLTGINQSSQNDWLVQEKKTSLGFKGLPSVPYCDFILLKNLTLSIRGLGFLICHVSIAISRVQWGYVPCGFWHV